MGRQRGHEIGPSGLEDALRRFAKADESMRPVRQSDMDAAKAEIGLAELLGEQVGDFTQMLSMMSVEDVQPSRPASPSLPHDALLLTSPQSVFRLTVSGLTAAQNRLFLEALSRFRGERVDIKVNPPQTTEEATGPMTFLCSSRYLASGRRI